jgi:hypothetical protein
MENNEVGLLSDERSTTLFVSHLWCGIVWGREDVMNERGYYDILSQVSQLSHDRQKFLVKDFFGE